MCKYYMFIENASKYGLMFFYFVVWVGFWLKCVAFSSYILAKLFVGSGWTSNGTFVLGWGTTRPFQVFTVCVCDEV